MKTFVKFGLITGLLVGLWNISCFSIVSWLNGLLHLGIPAARLRAYSGLLGIVILAVGIWLGMKNARRQNNFQLTYGQAIKTGIFMSLIAAVIVSCFSFLYCTIINPGYTDFMVKETGRSLTESHYTTEQINRQLQSARDFFSTRSQVLQALVGQSVAGTICSLIMGIFMRTKKN